MTNVSQHGTVLIAVILVITSILPCHSLSLPDSGIAPDSHTHGSTVFVIPTQAQPVFADRVWPVESLRQDFQQMRRFLETEHCCPYEYTGHEEFDRFFDKQFRLIDRPMTLNEFFRIAAPLAARVGCMHTALWMNGRFFDTTPGRMFPLTVRIIESQLVITGSYETMSGSSPSPVNADDDSRELPALLSPPPGSIITEINGLHASKILEELRRITSADALNPYFIETQVAKRFSMFYASVFGLADHYTVTCRIPGQAVEKVYSLQPATIQSVRSVVFANFNRPLPVMDILPDGVTALIRVPTFIYYDRVEPFREFMKTSFRLIREKGIKNLILDLRGNDGGDPFCAVILYSYLLKQPAPYFAESYGKYVSLADPVQIPENGFDGKVYVLIDGRCGSTNGHFCALLKYHDLVTFVGTPSGSTFVCNAGKNTEMTLANTSLILTVGRSSFAAAVSGMDKSKPIIPDVDVHETVEIWRTGRDVFMETVLGLIEAERSGEQIDSEQTDFDQSDDKSKEPNE
ncbi:hypothetical protein JW823_07185 [bacterium]|nr:hypothetical protein [candidate division CSSED10-310 bacterium]